MILEIVQAYPKISVIAFALLITLFISLVNYFIMDKDKVRDLRERQKSLQEKIKSESDPKRKMELSNEMMGHAMESMRHSFKPMLVTMIPVLLAFWFVKGLFAETLIAKTWIWYYLVSAIIGSLIFRKILKLP